MVRVRVANGHVIVHQRGGGWQIIDGALHVCDAGGVMFACHAAGMWLYAEKDQAMGEPVEVPS